MTHANASSVSRKAMLASMQLCIDFDSYMDAIQHPIRQNHAHASASNVSQDFIQTFIRPEQDPHGMYEHAYLCNCGSHWHVRNDFAPQSDLCPHCHSEIEPYVSDDGSFKKQQLENILINERIRIAFREIDIGRKVFDDFISKSALVNFIAEDVGIIAYR